jgi:hypothetical protein
MLERLRISGYSHAMHELSQSDASDNPRSADNQQERLIRLGWVLGFVDGEGCFSIGFVRQHGGASRIGYKTGYQVFHEFVVTQGSRSIDALRELQEFFGVGQVVINRRFDNHREPLYRYVVRRRDDLVNVVLPFFHQHPLRTAKRQDFDRFAACVLSTTRGEHLTREGLSRIVEVAQTMNRHKPRPELIKILRDQMPDADDSQRR